MGGVKSPSSLNQPTYSVGVSPAWPTTRDHSVPRPSSAHYQSLRRSTWPRQLDRIDTMLVLWFPQRAAVGMLLFHKPKRITMEEQAHDNRSDPP